MNSHNIIEGEKVAKQAIWGLLIVSIMKFIAGGISGMTVIIADSISTFTDILVVFAAYLGLRLSRKTADKNFEYGYYKFETMAAFLISLGIIYVGYLILMDAITTFGIVKVAHHRPFAITVTLLGIHQSYKLGKKLRDAGEKANSLALLASAKDKTVDMFSGIAVLCSIIANYQDIPYVESIVSILISLVILKVGFNSAKESLFFLLDYWNDPVLVKKIRKIFRQEEDLILSVKKLRLRRAGTFIFGEAYVEINPFADLSDLREELNLLQTKIKELDPYIKDFSIYTQINKNEKIKIAVPIKSGRTLNAVVANNLKETTAYLFAQINKNKIRSFYVKKLNAKEKKPAQLDNFIKNENIDILINNKLNSLTYYNLRRTHHILIYPNFSDIKTAQRTLELLLIDT